MKSNELISKSRDELINLLADLRANFCKLNFELAEKKIKNTSQIGKVKRDIARVLTVLNELKD